jgi:hypothetical protein
MNDRLAPPPRAPRGAWLLALLLLLLLAPPAPAAPTPAEGGVVAALPAAPETPVLLGSLRIILGDQKLMIQVGAVVALVGIFFLTRSIRGR